MPTASVATVGQAAPPSIETAFNAYRLGDLVIAEQMFQDILQATPAHFDALHLLGVLRTGQGRYVEAVRLIKQALKAKPNSVEALYNLGVALNGDQQHQSALSAYQRAIKLNPDLIPAYNNLGASLLTLERFEEAAQVFRHLLSIDPVNAEGHYNLGKALMSLLRHSEAVKCYRQALEIKPDYAQALNNLGAALCLLDRHREAIEFLEKALSIQPNLEDAHNTLGAALIRLGQYAESAEHFRAALAIQASPKAWAGLGYTYLRMCKGPESIDCYRQAVEMDPTCSGIHSDYIYSLDFIPETGFVEHQGERRVWYERHGLKFERSIKRHLNDLSPDRKLRIGYVSADFNNNSPSLAFGPVLYNHDRTQFDFILYSENAFDSSNTQGFRNIATLWRETRKLPDKAMAQLIRDDEIDILVDLSGHSYGNRLLVFCHRPAPVQVTAWGYATGTGVPTMDYLFADTVSVPHEARPLFAEKIFDLPCIIGHVVPDYAPEVNDLPCASGEPFTFGCLNRLNKVTHDVVSLWSRLLRELPGSRLLLKDAQLSDSGERYRIQAEFASHGITDSRLVLMPGTSHPEHLRAFSRIDIALDPFPTTGGISTLEAMWMGVPVVAMLGNGIPSRVGAAIVSAAGLTDWVAHSEDEYVEIAKRHAGDRSGLAKLRAGLRSSLALSPLGDSVKYCHAVEDAYRTMWHRYCETAANR